jgi:hypothetical protein
MSFLQLSDHTFAVYQSEHAYRLEEIDDDDDEDEEEEVVETDDDTYLESIGGGALGLDDDDDWSTSATSVRVVKDEGSSAPHHARTGKSNVQTPPIQDRFCLSSHKQARGSKAIASTVTLDKSHAIATLLYESLSDILSSSQRGLGISALGKVARNIDSLASAESRDAQKDKLTDLLADEICGFNGPEHRSALSTSGPHSTPKEAMTIGQQNQLVDAIAGAFSKIEVLLAADAADAMQGSIPKATVNSPRAIRADNGKVTVSCPTDKRRPSYYSDVSSLTSGTSTSLPYAPSTVAKGPPPSKPSEPSKAPSKPLGDYLGIALQDSFSTVRSLDSEEDALPKRPERHCSTRDLALHDSFTSFCSLDSDDDKAPERPERCDSFRVAKGGATAEKTAATTRASNDGPRRTGGRRKTDVRVAAPQRRRSFDEEI